MGFSKFLNHLLGLVDTQASNNHRIKHPPAYLDVEVKTGKATNIQFAATPSDNLMRIQKKWVKLKDNQNIIIDSNGVIIKDKPPAQIQEDSNQNDIFFKIRTLIEIISDKKKIKERYKLKEKRQPFKVSETPKTDSEVEKYSYNHTNQEQYQYRKEHPRPLISIRNSPKERLDLEMFYEEVISPRVIEYDSHAQEYNLQPHGEKQTEQSSSRFKIKSTGITSVRHPLPTHNYKRKNPNKSDNLLNIEAIYENCALEETLPDKTIEYNETQKLSEGSRPNIIVIKKKKRKILTSTKIMETEVNIGKVVSISKRERTIQTPTPHRNVNWYTIDPKSESVNYKKSWLPVNNLEQPVHYSMLKIGSHCKKDPTEIIINKQRPQLLTLNSLSKPHKIMTTGDRIVTYPFGSLYGYKPMAPPGILISVA